MIAKQSNHARRAIHCKSFASRIICVLNDFLGEQILRDKRCLVPEAVVTYCELGTKRRLAPKDAHQKLFRSFFDGYGDRYGHTNHRVVACAR